MCFAGGVHTRQAQQAGHGSATECPLPVPSLLLLAKRFLCSLPDKSAGIPLQEDVSFLFREKPQFSLPTSGGASSPLESPPALRAQGRPWLGSRCRGGGRVDLVDRSAPWPPAPRARPSLRPAASPAPRGGCGMTVGIQKPAVLLHPVPVPCEARSHSCGRAVRTTSAKISAGSARHCSTTYAHVSRSCAVPHLHRLCSRAAR